MPDIETAVAVKATVPLESRIARFVAPASIEITPHDAGSLPGLTRLLPSGATVYVAHTPKFELQQVITFAARVQALGFRAIVHLVARALRSETQLRNALRELQEAGCDSVLLVAGDQATPAGPFSSTLEVLATGATVDAGITTVAFAGHPGGNPAIGAEALATALEAKQTFARGTGTNVLILTQFAFNAEVVLAWSRQICAQGIHLPIHVGLAGPTPLPKLIRYAIRCGIGVSLKSLTRTGHGLESLANLAQLKATPNEMLIGLVQGRNPSLPENIVQPHFFSFGGCIETAQWLKAVREERFTLNVDGHDFTLT